MGTWLLLGGFAAYAGTSLVRFGAILLRRAWIIPTLVIGFYARSVAMVGIVVMIAGAILRGDAEWWTLPLVLVLGGATAIAILVTRPVTTDNPLGMNGAGWAA